MLNDIECFLSEDIPSLEDLECLPLFGIASRYVEAKSKYPDLQNMQSRSFASNPTKSGDFAEQSLYEDIMYP
jgi:hypothetical protein